MTESVKGLMTRTWDSSAVDSDLEDLVVLRQAVDLLPEDVTAENGQTVGDVREGIERQEWEMVLGVLIETGDLQPAARGFLGTSC
ncbi:hypothetical protein [Streptomyces sp. NPDC101165]|uniref:hypothetical protein n=1 Tax=Streptomyces sp. NPDC101165 TaxID=3366119 RepID=UPI00380F7AF7